MMDKPNEVAISRVSSPIIGGVFSIVSASITILFIFIIFLIEYIKYLSGDLPFPPGSTYFLSMGGMRTIWLVVSILAIIGGILAIKRKNWALSVIGVAASIFCIPVFLGIIGTVIVARSRTEFELRKNH